MSSASYMLKTPARVLVPHVADEDQHAFLVGTCTLRGQNEIRLLRYYEEDDDIECAAVYTHTYEITAIAPHPRDATLIATVYQKPEGLEASIWRMPAPAAGRAGEDGSGSAAAVPLTHVCTLSHTDTPTYTRVMYVQWFPATDASASSSGEAGENKLLAVSETAIRVWTVHADGRATVSREIATSDVEIVGGAAWDPHHANEVAVATDSSIHVWDVRSGEAVRAIVNAVPPGACVRALSYNPNKPWHLASAGDDYRVKVWDLRKVATPVKILDGHTHWVTSVAFNPFHDQLMLSSGTDARVTLWRVSSISSAPLLELGDDEDDGATGRKKETKLAPDIALRTHEDHDDSVYAACWSAKNAWVYASLSYTGKVVVSQVPSAEKYKILL